MDSIDESISIRKGALGWIIKGQRGHYYGTPPPERVKGDITRFSSASARRLREVLATAHPRKGDHIPYGFTFTIPGSSLNDDEVRRLWHIFVVKWKRSFRFPMVWRIELQKKSRLQAHWHCVVWIPRSGSGCSSDAFAVQIEMFWIRLIRDFLPPLSAKTDFGFDKHGVQFRRIDDSTPSGVIGYLCDHTSKHKASQLGWRGRQWGVVNRSLLTFDTILELSVSERVHVQAARQYRRLQDVLRKRGGRYTGVKVTPAGNVSKVVFGRDADRIVKLERFFNSQDDKVPTGNPSKH